MIKEPWHAPCHTRCVLSQDVPRCNRVCKQVLLAPPLIINGALNLLRKGGVSTVGVLEVILVWCHMGTLPPVPLRPEYNLFNLSVQVTASLLAGKKCSPSSEVSLSRSIAALWHH